MNEPSKARRNVFVLTTGLSGSSVITGLISQAGYWTGEKTEFKNNSTGYYETYENSQFVSLNNRLVDLSGKSFDSLSWYDMELREHYKSLINQIDLSEFEAFVNCCNGHRPWILKDPKLLITIGFWLELFDNNQVDCIIIKRKCNRLWLSQTLKRTIYDYFFLKHSEADTYKGLKDFLGDKQIPYLEVEYDDLLGNTRENLNKLNGFLKCNLTPGNWRNVYQVGKGTNQSLFIWMKAILIYLKNYSSRIK